MFHKNDINATFAPQKPLIEPVQFKNQNNVLHNNLHENLLKDHLKEHYINIDSKDRDAKLNANPFSYTVHFGIPSSSYHYDKKTNKKTYYVNQSKPVIRSELKNVKMIKINSLIMPLYTTIIKNSVTSEYTVDKQDCLTKHRYLLMRIREFSSDDVLGTNEFLDTCFIISVFDTVKDYYICYLPHPLKIFPNSSLRNINKITIDFFTPEGEPLEIRIVNENGQTVHEKLDTDESNYKHVNNAYHPLYQHLLSLIIGTMNCELNTAIKYDR
jgi:hypothetical protein